MLLTFALKMLCKDLVVRRFRLEFCGTSVQIDGGPIECVFFGVERVVINGQLEERFPYVTFRRVFCAAHRFKSERMEAGMKVVHDPLNSPDWSGRAQNIRTW